jgi:ABC-type uncharacterized transport system substrate-binding protein
MSLAQKRKPQIDTVGWLFLAFAVTITAAEANDAMVANAPAIAPVGPYVSLHTNSEPDQLDAAASALAQIPVDVIIVFGTPRAQAAQRATKTIPIVAISIGDPIGAGLVTSLAHPGGNITGNTILGPDIVTKRLLKDAIPAVTRALRILAPLRAKPMTASEYLIAAAMRCAGMFW